MKRRFAWNPDHKKGRQHVIENGRVVCDQEKGFSATLRERADRRCSKRRLCGQCAAIIGERHFGKKKAKPKKRAKAFKIDAFYSTKEWRQVRYLALKQCGARCQCCGASAADGARLNVDHIKPRGRYPELALCLSNLQVLCGACNHGKGGWDETDWREPYLATLMGERVDFRKA